MQPYPVVSSNGTIIYSFPMSHDLYITEFKSDSYTKVYAGSNLAGTICSVDWNGLSGYLYQDLYGAILYDPWRKVYYRFMEQEIKYVTTSRALDQKPIIVIIMDDEFNYLGETLIGTGEQWNWKNSFVTEDGLNIEFLDKKMGEEKFLNFKIFSIEKIGII